MRKIRGALSNESPLKLYEINLLIKILYKFSIGYEILKIQTDGYKPAEIHDRPIQVLFNPQKKLRSTSLLCALSNARLAT